MSRFKIHIQKKQIINENFIGHIRESVVKFEISLSMGESGRQWNLPLTQEKNNSELYEDLTVHCEGFNVSHCEQEQQFGKL